MKEYLISIVLTAVSIAISELILPQGKLKTIVNTVFSLTILISVISPLSSSEEINADFIFNEIDSNLNQYDSSINNYFDMRAEELYAIQFKNQLLENNLVAEQIIVEIYNMKINKIKIYLSNLVIPEENSHINNNVIAIYIANVLEVDQEMVEVYA